MSPIEEKCYAIKLNQKIECSLCGFRIEVASKTPYSCMASIELRKAVRNGWVDLHSANK